MPIVVIGVGVSGASVAHRLAEAGVRMTVLEAPPILVPASPGRGRIRLELAPFRPVRFLG